MNYWFNDTHAFRDRRAAIMTVSVWKDTVHLSTETASRLSRSPSLLTSFLIVCFHREFLIISYIMCHHLFHNWIHMSLLFLEYCGGKCVKLHTDWADGVSEVYRVLWKVVILCKFISEWIRQILEDFVSSTFSSTVTCADRRSDLCWAKHSFNLN